MTAQANGPIIFVMSEPTKHEKFFKWDEVVQSLILDAFASCEADIFLFGSRAKHRETNRSDYDVGYDTAHPPSPSKLAQLQEALEELPILAKVDLVDFRKVPPEFNALALKNIKIWKRKNRNSLFTSKP